MSHCLALQESVPTVKLGDPRVRVCVCVMHTASFRFQTLRVSDNK